MKSDFEKDRFIIECECHSPDHLLIVDCEDVDDNKDNKERITLLISVYFSANWKAPWYKRIWYALEFIFYRKKFCWGDDIVIGMNNLHQLKEVVEFLDKRSKNIS